MALDKFEVKLPKVTVITVVYNGERHIEETIQSVITQTYSNLEYIIVDGGSSDHSVDIIRKYEAKIDLWISEPDGGISDAMNKGVALASGDYILFIHADDYLNGPEALSECLNRHPLKGDLHAYDVYFIDEHSTREIHTKEFGWWVNVKGRFCHQGILCKRNTFTRVGMFDTSLRIKMDYDFLLRCYRAGLVLKSHRFLLASMRGNGVSSAGDYSTLISKLQEEKRIHYRCSNSVILRAFYCVWWLIYPAYSKVKFKINDVWSSILS